jgi:hypothetical protein
MTVLNGHYGMGRVLAFVIAVVVLGGPALGDGKKLEVAVEKAAVRLDPDAKSPVVEMLPRGAVIALASPLKMKKNWLYVYFTSLGSGKTRSGYLLETEVRKLYPELKVVHISTEGEILNPSAVNPDAFAQPVVEWGTTRASIESTEGKPLQEYSSGGVHVLQYKRTLMDKKCLIEYVLDKDRLVTARCHLLENYADKARYVEDYNVIRVFLTSRVGTPRSDKVVWQGRPEEQHQEPLGEALLKGQVEFSSEWVFRDTSVHLVLMGADNRVTLGAEITDVKSRNPASF